jgi:transposase
LAYVHHELRRPGVTLMMLSDEDRQQEPDGYRYGGSCEMYRAWESSLSPTMRPAHPAGEQMFRRLCPLDDRIALRPSPVGCPG